MRGVTAIALAAVLVAVFLGLVAVLLAQEGRSRRLRGSDPREYVLTDAAAWVWELLSPTTRVVVDRADVLRILEWQVFFLQESVKGIRRGGAEVVVGDTPEAVDYVVERCRLQGYDYAPDVVAEVLEHQGSYLVSIGAVAAPAGRG